jgi:hypothetical protein
MTQSRTQKQRIIAALRTWISPLDALHKAGTMKLSSRVSDLRREGHQIEDKWAPDKAYKLYRIHPDGIPPDGPKTVWVAKKC